MSKNDGTLQTAVERVLFDIVETYYMVLQRYGRCERPEQDIKMLNPDIPLPAHRIGLVLRGMEQDFPRLPKLMLDTPPQVQQGVLEDTRSFQLFVSKFMPPHLEMMGSETDAILAFVNDCNAFYSPTLVREMWNTQEASKKWTSHRGREHSNTHYLVETLLTENSDALTPPTVQPAKQDRRPKAWSEQERQELWDTVVSYLAGNPELAVESGIYEFVERNKPTRRYPSRRVDQVYRFWEMNLASQFNELIEGQSSSEVQTTIVFQKTNESLQPRSASPFSVESIVRFLLQYQVAEPEIVALMDKQESLMAKRNVLDVAIQTIRLEIEERQNNTSRMCEEIEQVLQNFEDWRLGIPGAGAKLGRVFINGAGIVERIE